MFIHDVLSRYYLHICNISLTSPTSGAGEDYVSISQNLEFGPSTTRQCLLVLLIQDGVCETTMTERFEVQLTNQNTVQDVASVVIYDASECSEWSEVTSYVITLSLLVSGVSPPI